MKNKRELLTYGNQLYVEKKKSTVKDDGQGPDVFTTE